MVSLRGVRVLEVAEMVGGPYASKLLADLGSEVIKVEPPGGDRSRRIGPYPDGHGGDPERSGVHLGLNTNKRSVVLDLGSSPGRTRLAELVAGADLVVHDLAPSRAAAVGLDADELLARRPELVVLALTPYGSTGPQAEWAGCELTVVHGGGWGYLIPGDDPDPTAPPLTVPGWAATQQAAMAGAFAALGALYKSQATGVGEYIDMSIMGQVSAMLEASFIAWSYMGNIARRNDGRILTPWRILECRDGLIFLVCVEQDQWERLVDMMGNPEWATLGIFDTQPDRALNQDVLNIYLEEWTRQHTVEELWHEGQRRRICFAPVLTMADLADQPHLHERGFFHRVSHPVAGELTHLGSPYVMEPSHWSLRTPAPILDATADPTWAPRADGANGQARVAGIGGDDARRRPLEGVRVIDFSWVWAGPFASMHLAYLGADVIKIESPERPSLGRRLPIHPPELEPTLNTCGYFNQWDQGKRSVEVHIDDPDAVDTVLELIADADVVLDNYATGVMDRLGLGDEVLFGANPDLIVGSVTGYGHTGPLRHYMGYGPTTCPLSGLTAMTGHPGGPPMEAGLSIGDPAAGMTLAFAVMVALFGRTPGDGGARIDISLWEATAGYGLHAWMAHQLGHEPQGPQGSRHFAASPHGVFRASGDDDWVAIACMTEEHWQALAPLLGDGVAADPRFATLADRKANEVELEALVTAWTTRRERWEIAEQLQGLGIPAYPSLTCAEVESNPQHVARGFWEHFDHPEVGVRTHSGVPWRTRNWPNGVTSRAPLLGEHTDEIMAGLRQQATR